MQFTRTKAAAIAAVAGVLALTSGPAQASSASATDAVGVDYDAACLVRVALTPPSPNSITSPGAGCPGVSLYDGSTTGTDLVNSTAGTATSLASDANGRVVATFHIAGRVPMPGNTTPPDGTAASFDLPTASSTGAAYFALFQNKTAETNWPTNSLGGRPQMPQTTQSASYGGLLGPGGPGGPPYSPHMFYLNSGCKRVGTGTPVFDQYGSWKDGYHFFVNLVVNWDGTEWAHRVQIGEYNPGPSGGFPFYEVGANNGGGWISTNPYVAQGPGPGQWDVSITPNGAGTDVMVAVPGLYKDPDVTSCQEGYFTHAFAKPGDVIGNVKALTSANIAVTLPVTVPLHLLCALSGGAVCESDVTTVGGYTMFSDVTDGGSTPGLLNTNISGIAYSGGAVGVTDTLGDGPTCPTATFGGLMPKNPLFTPDTACQIDDDDFGFRGSFLSEWWDTPHGFTF